MYRIQGIKTSFYVCRFCDPFKYRFQHRKIAHEYEQVCVFSRLCIVICLDWSAISIWFKFYSLPCYTLPLLFLLCVYSIFIDIFAFRVAIMWVSVCVWSSFNKKVTHLDIRSKFKDFILFVWIQIKYLLTCACILNERTDGPIDHSFRTIHMRAARYKVISSIIIAICWFYQNGLIDYYIECK